LRVLAELDMGQRRTGCASPADAAALAAAIAAAPGLTFAGVQGYWGHLQQVSPLDERRRRAGEEAGRLRELLARLSGEGRSVAIVTGGGTGTSAIDPDLGLFTEIQPGSYLFLDSAYGAIDVDAGGNPFRPSLFVSAEVVSSVRPGRAVVNAGLKAFATDSGRPVPLRGAPSGATYTFMGDEHGAVDHDPDAGRIAPGTRIEFLTSHCDPTVNLYRAYHVRRGGAIVDVWPIAAHH
jgi:D-serine deaminase-like pyridoxal phosphate-dependent protein